MKVKGGLLGINGSGRGERRDCNGDKMTSGNYLCV
jgi:hypothetical protein